MRLNNMRFKRHGNIIVLTALFMLTILALFALAVDIGYLCLAKTQLQAAADSAALAGAGALFPYPSALEVPTYVGVANSWDARTEAQLFVNYNSAAQHQETLTVDLNPSNQPNGDIVLGRWNKVLRIFEPDDINISAICVRIPMTFQHDNGNVQFPFGFLADTAPTGAFAIAIVHYPVVLPFSTSVDKWTSANDGDNYTLTPNGVELGADGIPEIVIFPVKNWDESQGLPPGNFGALRIGQGGTANMRNQIAYGPTVEDLEPYGGELYEGLTIPGETGIMAGMELAFIGGHADGIQYSGILGETRYLPLYEYVSGNGANAKFTITQFVGVRVMAVNLQSATKWIRLQPVASVSDLMSLHLVK